MRIAAISDMHGQLPQTIPEADIIVIAGDICPDLRPIYKQRKWLDKTFRQWLPQPPTNVRVLGTWGNHDIIGQHKLRLDLPIELFIDQCVDVNGVTFFFTPWVPNLGQWAFAYADDVPMELRFTIPEGIDVLVSHGPPMLLMDNVQEGPHVGSNSLLERCIQIKPKVVICGHIHEARGTHVTPWGGTIYNVSSIDRMYRPYPERWTIIDI